MKIKITTYHGTDTITGKELLSCIGGGIFIAGLLIVVMYMPDIFR